MEIALFIITLIIIVLFTLYIDEKDTRKKAEIGEKAWKEAYKNSREKYEHSLDYYKDLTKTLSDKLTACSSKVEGYEKALKDKVKIEKDDNQIFTEALTLDEQGQALELKKKIKKIKYLRARDRKIIDRVLGIILK